MRASVDRDLVARLLQDESLSYREIARRAGCSDFSVRSIARELADEYSIDDDEPPDPLTPTQWGIVACIAALLLGAICFAAWRTPPLDGGSMQ